MNCRLTRVCLLCFLRGLVLFFEKVCLGLQGRRRGKPRGWPAWDSPSSGAETESDLSWAELEGEWGLISSDGWMFPKRNGQSSGNHSGKWRLGRCGSERDTEKNIPLVCRLRVMRERPRDLKTRWRQGLRLNTGRRMMVPEDGSLPTRRPWCPPAPKATGKSRSLRIARGECWARAGTGH